MARLKVSEEEAKAKRRATGRRWYARNAAKKKAAVVAWQRANPERFKATSKRSRDRRPGEGTRRKRLWRAANPEKEKATWDAYYVLHGETIRQRALRWARMYPELARARRNRWRARQRQAPVNDLTAAQWREIKAAYNFQCAFCGKTSQRLTQDHLTPLSKGGSHTVMNVVPACQSCNSRKSAGPVLVPVQPLLLTVS